jgi:cell wall-associated NlpC family hydrolase
MSVQKIIQFRYILLGSIVLGLFSCSTSRHIEKGAGRQVYKSLGLTEDRKDNVALYREAASWMHVPHRDGGTSRKGTDCSFLVYSVYKTVYNKILERNSSDMMNKNCKQVSRSKLKEGDLVFFNTSNKSRSDTNISHVGIYLKENKFLHASTSKGVNVSDLDEDYYRKTWVCGGRVK